jgi:putative membrane protein
MKALVLAIDRDDDFGKKAGVRGPIIGKGKCIDAALKLSLADPEDITQEKKQKMLKKLMKQ